MGREIVYCQRCGARILEEDFEKGKALVLSNKSYCHQCKGGVLEELAPDERAKLEDTSKTALAQKKAKTFAEIGHYKVASASKVLRKDTHLKGFRAAKQSSFFENKTLWLVIGITLFLIIVVVVLSQKK